MSISSEYDGYDAEDLVIDRETWKIHFQEVLEKSPETAEGLSRVLLYLLQAVESGPEGIEQVSNSLKDGIEWAYLYTDAHKAALRLFLLYMEGHLEVQDAPDRLIGGAVKRGVENARK